MEYALKLLSVFLTSMLELWAAIPMGFVLGIDPLTNSLVSIAGAFAGSAVVIFGGEKIRKFFEKKAPQDNTEAQGGKKGTARVIWEKYGAAGLGLLAPWITGAPLAAAIGIGLKADPKKLLIWLLLGIVICTAVLVAMGIFGLSLFKKS